MEKNRLEAFSDGVIAVILTIMVLDLKVPRETTLDGLAGLWPIYVAYALSYVNVFFVWLNHHDIFASLKEVNRPLLIANGVLLFCVSLIPFATAYVSESHWTAQLPAVLYGLIMVLVSLAFAHLRSVAGRCAREHRIVAHHRAEARISLLLAAAFLVGALCSWFAPRSGLFFYVAAPTARSLMRTRRRSSTLPGQ